MYDVNRDCFGSGHRVEDIIIDNPSGTSARTRDEPSDHINLHCIASVLNFVLKTSLSTFRLELLQTCEDEAHLSIPFLLLFSLVYIRKM